MPNVLSLLQSVETISSCRDRGRLHCALSEAAVALLGESADIGIFVRSAPGDAALRTVSGSAIDYAELPGWGDFIEAVPVGGEVLTCTIEGRSCGAVALHASELANEQMIFAYDVGRDDAARHAEEIACLARIYGSQIKLLDYSELDTLTRLLNRKTFDETFDRLLTAQAANCAEGGFADRRGNAEDGSPAWLCVVDVDHFKRVNDSFGHLFGDEVLLRMGELMRKTFRGGDRLFRFGGEEFVVILNAADEKLAAASFNRFRLSVESHEFPQVGQVTCSIGFTAVSAMDVPTDVVGRADEALYFAKEHGRNQVCCYEQLVAEGAIEKPAPAEAPAADDFDIDALFG